MRRTLVVLSLFALAAPLFAGRHGGHRGLSMSIDDDGVVNDCSQMRVTINDRPAVRAEEIVPVGLPRSLAVHAPENGGIYVTGSQSSGYEVKACKAAAFHSALSDIRVRISGNEVTADGPDDGTWVVSMRSRGATDLSRVAMALGGGGHRAAAGYSSALDLGGTVARLFAHLAA